MRDVLRGHCRWWRALAPKHHIFTMKPRSNRRFHGKCVMFLNGGGARPPPPRKSLLLLGGVDPRPASPMSLSGAPPLEAKCGCPERGLSSHQLNYFSPRDPNLFVSLLELPPFHMFVFSFHVFVATVHPTARALVLSQLGTVSGYLRRPRTHPEHTLAAVRPARPTRPK